MGLFCLFFYHKCIDLIRRKKIKISLIVATIGRRDSLMLMLQSILSTSYDLSKIEIVIVDQNQNSLLDDISKLYSTLTIIHIKSSVVGLSTNRNIGFKESSGDIICFPDDDCKFYPNTFCEMLKVNI